MLHNTEFVRYKRAQEVKKRHVMIVTYIRGWYYNNMKLTAHDLKQMNKATLARLSPEQLLGWFKKVDFSEHLTSKNLPCCDMIWA